MYTLSISKFSILFILYLFYILFSKFETMEVIKMKNDLYRYLLIIYITQFHYLKYF